MISVACWWRKVHLIESFIPCGQEYVKRMPRQNQKHQCWRVLRQLWRRFTIRWAMFLTLAKADLATGKEEKANRTHARYQHSLKLIIHTNDHKFVCRFWFCDPLTNAGSFLAFQKQDTQYSDNDYSHWALSIVHTMKWQPFSTDSTTRATHQLLHI